MPRATIKKILSNPRPIDFFAKILSIKDETYTFCLKTKRVRDSKGRFIKNTRAFSERIDGWESKKVLETDKSTGEKKIVEKTVPIIKHVHEQITSLFHFGRKALGERRYLKRHAKQHVNLDSKRRTHPRQKPTSKRNFAVA